MFLGDCGFLSDPQPFPHLGEGLLISAFLKPDP